MLFEEGPNTSEAMAGQPRLGVLYGLVRPLAIAIPLWTAGLVYLGFIFTSASAAAKAARDDSSFLKTLIGIPILEGFSNGGKFGVHLHWGILVLLVAPIVLAMLPIVGSFLRRGTRK